MRPTQQSNGSLATSAVSLRLDRMLWPMTTWPGLLYWRTWGTDKSLTACLRRQGHLCWKTFSDQRISHFCLVTLLRFLTWFTFINQSESDCFTCQRICNHGIWNAKTVSMCPAASLRFTSLNINSIVYQRLSIYHKIKNSLFSNV